MLKTLIVLCLSFLSLQLLSYLLIGRSDSILHAEEFYDKYYSNVAKLKNCEKIIIDERAFGIKKQSSITICYWDIGDHRIMWKEVGSHNFGITYNHLK